VARRAPFLEPLAVDLPAGGQPVAAGAVDDHLVIPAPGECRPETGDVRSQAREGARRRVLGPEHVDELVLRHHPVVDEQPREDELLLAAGEGHPPVADGYLERAEHREGTFHGPPFPFGATLVARGRNRSATGWGYDIGGHR
jgi:hypothetical protein